MSVAEAALTSATITPLDYCRQSLRSVLGFGEPERIEWRAQDSYVLRGGWVYTNICVASDKVCLPCRNLARIRRDHKALSLRLSEKLSLRLP